jgi:hypothetical protein
MEEEEDDDDEEEEDDDDEEEDAMEEDEDEDEDENKDVKLFSCAHFFFIPPSLMTTSICFLCSVLTRERSCHDAHAGRRSTTHPLRRLNAQALQMSSPSLGFLTCNAP